MHTQCPYCQTLFQISTKQLLTANGKAHCCRCDRIFDARKNLREPAGLGTTPISPGDTTTWATTDPSTDQQRSDPTTLDEAPSATQGEYGREEASDQAAGQISVSHLFEQLQYDDPLRRISEAESKTTDEQSQSDLIPSLEIEPFLLDSDQGQFSVYDEEEIAVSIPDLGDIDRKGLDDALPTFPTDATPPKDSGPASWQSEPEAPLEPVFGAEFMLSQLDQAESIPVSPNPSGMTEAIPAARGYIDSITDMETPPEVGELLQEREPAETRSESDQSEQIQPEEASEPPFQVPGNLPAIEPAEGGSLYPEELLTTTGQDKRHNFAWSLAVLALLLLVVGQATWLGRDQLMNYPTTRKLLDSFCQRTGCQLPEQRAPDQIEILNRSVASHPQTPNALQILLTLSNQASFHQPYPQIQLSLFNTKDELLARRRFRPEEYLAQVTGSYPLLRTKQPVQLEIVLQDPGEEATGFKFDFF